METVITLKGLEKVADLVAQALSHIALGTGGTSATRRDVGLESESVRKGVSYRRAWGTSCQVRAFFLNHELPQTVREYGAFLNGTDQSGSGVLLLRHTSTLDRGNNDFLVVVELEFKDAG